MEHSPMRGPSSAFLFDLVMAILIVLALSMGTGAAWAVFQGVQHALGAGDGQGLTEPGAIALICIAIIGTGGAALVMYFWRRRATVQERESSLRAARQWSTWALAAATGIAMFLFSSTVAWLGRQVGIQPEPTNQQMIEAAYSISPLFLFAFAALLAPAYEELLFRRVLFGRFLAANKVGLGMLLSSLAFAFVHEIPGLSANPFPAMLLLWFTYGVMGAAFAWVYWRTGTLWAAIGAHAVNNALALAAMVWMSAA